MTISPAFQSFSKEAPSHYTAWLEAVAGLGKASVLDARTQSLVYIGILAAARLESGLAFHVQEAKAHGASRDEIVSAVLAGLPAVGNCVVQALPIALEAFDHN
ncbi:carboxymuconolactone decarboxylase family protein [Agrobacterium sp. SORGH_AS 787]|uniref:carboxymuconolactone decarboxylase family protein n=1 Tax=Agrobacterium sp. SORGH_AS 787 TaxID=3041775 RepID=UPI00278B9AA3|nr:alkylhydroperoxidase/carboxymuconolactone decarboxylase family protein YurZ [Rhizobium sp. SORGH_AS_0787]